MTDFLDRKIRQLVHEVVDAAPSAAGVADAVGAQSYDAQVVGLGLPRSPRRVLLAVAAVAVVALGAVTLTRDRDAATDVAESQPAQPARLLADVATLAEGEWVLPTALPDTLKDADPVFLSHGENRLAPPGGAVMYNHYQGAGSDLVVAAWHYMGAFAGDEILIAGTTWIDTGSQLRRVLGIDQPSPLMVIVESRTLTTDELADVAANLVVMKEDDLPGPVLGTQAETDVAETVLGGQRVTLGVNGTVDGFEWVTSGPGDGLTGSCCPGLPPHRFVALIDSNFHPGLGHTISGVAALEVAAVDIVLGNGETVRVEPSSFTDEFGVNFFIIGAEGGEETPDTFNVTQLTSYDGDGNVLAVESPEIRAVD